MSAPFADAVRRQLEAFGSSLQRTGTGGDFSVSDDDGSLILRTRRASDGGTAVLTVSGTTEVYLLTLCDIYTTARTGYDDDSKREALDELLAYLEAFLIGDYYEEIGERKGRVVSRQIHLTVFGETSSIAARGGLRAGVGRVLGYQKSIVRPAGN